MAGMTAAAIALIIVISVALTIWPVQIAARMVGARHAGLLRCLAALIVANVLHGIGLAVPVLGSLVAFFLSAVGFAVLLGTGYLRALVIAVLQAVITFVIAVAIVFFFGGALGFAAWSGAGA